MSKPKPRLQHWTENHPPHAGGWRTDTDNEHFDPGPDFELPGAPGEIWWFIGTAILAIMLIVTAALIGAGVFLS